MDLTDYRLEPASLDAEWDDFVERSPQGTLFCESLFASSLRGEFLPFSILKKNERKAVILLMGIADDATGLHDLLIHNGPMMAPSDGQQNDAQALSEEFRILSFLATRLAAEFGIV